MSKREYIRAYVKHERLLAKQRNIIICLAIFAAIEGIAIICLATSLFIGEVTV